MNTHREILSPAEKAVLEKLFQNLSLPLLSREHLHCENGLAAWRRRSGMAYAKPHSPNTEEEKRVLNKIIEGLEARELVTKRTLKGLSAISLTNGGDLALMDAKRSAGAPSPA